ncbi:hypothetical protein GCM10010912_64230 [Paenibacillus albidus]|uniref:Uncharacterized protein n=1 Tax=Paenibacillus albidus TaxID=2041023 RepID=A0A917D5D6_9BACL|nr:hypothetical protein GCM10010912_64230 [Paenibacillus albidus]
MNLILGFSSQFMYSNKNKTMKDRLSDLSWSGCRESLDSLIYMQLV